MSRGKNRLRRRRRFIGRSIEERSKEQAKNRKKMLEKMDPETREFAEKEFAKLGLYQ